MGGSIGRLAIGAVGFGLGSMVGFPALGASLAMGLGGMLFPPKQESKQRQVRAILGSSSVEGTPLTVVFGRVRIGGTLLWKGSLVYHEVEVDGKGGGKGGGGSGAGETSYYTLSFAVVLGEGELELRQIYENKNKISPSYTFYTGTEDQLADSFLTAQTGKAIRYKHTSYIVFQDYNLGPTANIPQLTFEVVAGQSYFDVSLTVTDTLGIVRNETKIDYIKIYDAANPVTPPYAIKSMILNDRFGAGFEKNVNWLEANTDCIDRDYYINIAITERRSLAELIELFAAHGWIITVFSGSDVRLLLAKATTPAISYDLNDMVGREHESVIDVAESSRSERYNRVSVEYTDPAKEFSVRPVQVEDLADQHDRGVVKNTVALPGFIDKDITKDVGYKMMRNSLFGRRIMNFSLGPKELATEPGDLVYLNGLSVGLTETRCRIIGVDETEEFNLAITAREEPVYIFDSTGYIVPDSLVDPVQDTSAGLSNAINFRLLEIPKEISSTTSAVDMMPIYGKQHDDTIGYNIYISVDDTAYDIVHTSRKPLPYGVIGTTIHQNFWLDSSEIDVDTSSGLNQTGSSFSTISRTTMMYYKNITLVDDELMLHQNSTLVATDSYTFDTFVRNRFNTLATVHAPGTYTMHINNASRFQSPKLYIGSSFYFKAVPVNIYGFVGDIDEATAIQVTIEGWAYRPYRPGSIWMEESGIKKRGRSRTTQADIEIGWSLVDKETGYGRPSYDSGTYGMYSQDSDFTSSEVEVYATIEQTPLSNTSLLLHMNGSDGSTTFTDDGGTGHSPVAIDDAQIDTTQSVFSGASGVFDGSDTVEVPDHSDWDIASSSNLFTVDFRVRFASGGAQGIVCQHESNTRQWGIYYESNELIFNSTYTSGKLWFKCAWTPSINTWYHVALVRSGSARYIFIDGVEQSLTGDFNSNITALSAPLQIGRYEKGVDFLTGWIDEFRISKGVARWEAGFTPPTVEYVSQDPDPLFALQRTTDVGTDQDYTYTDAMKTADGISGEDDITFRVYTKSVYGRSRDYQEKRIINNL